MKSKNSYINQFRDAVVDAEMPLPCKMTLIVIARYANSMKGTAFPSQKTIADRLSVSERTVRRYICQLIEAGWMEIIRRAHGGDGRIGAPNEYQLIIGENFKSTSKPTPLANVVPIAGATEAEPEDDSEADSEYLGVAGLSVDQIVDHEDF